MSAQAQPVSDSSATVSARGVDDLLGFVGHTFGGLPVDSVVMISLSGPRLRAGVRFDAPDPAACTGAGLREWAQTAAATLARDTGADACLALLIEPAAGPCPHRPLAARIREAFADAGVPVAAAWVVSAGMSWAWTAQGEGIDVGPDAQPRPLRDPRLSTVSLAMTMQGSVFADVPEPERVPTPVAGRPGWPAPQAHDADDAVCWLETWADVLASGREAGPVLLRRLAAPLVHRGWRDALVALAVAGPQPQPPGAVQARPEGPPGRQSRTSEPSAAAVSGDLASLYLADTGVRPCWEWLDQLRRGPRGGAQHAPAEVAVEALAVAGWVSWARGHGSAAAAHLQSALRADPGHTLSRLLAQLLRRGEVAGWACDPSTAWRPESASRVDPVA